MFNYTGDDFNFKILKKILSVMFSDYHQDKKIPFDI